MRRVVLALALALQAAPAAGELLTVTLLGTGTPRPDINRFSQSILVEAGDTRLLFDAGRGAAMRLHQIGVLSAQIDRVFLTHLHYDHIVGLDDVWLTARLWQREEPLEVHGPKGVENLVESLRQAYVVDRHVRKRQSGLPDETGELVGTEIKQGEVYRQGKLKVTAVEVNHGAVKPAFGYRIDYGERSVVISGDTAYSENLVAAGQGADVVIHDTMMASEALLEENPRLQRVVAYHASPEQVGRVLAEVEAKLGILVHLLRFGVSEQDVLDGVASKFDGEVRLGQDLMAVDIGDAVSVYQRR